MTQAVESYQRVGYYSASHIAAHCHPLLDFASNIVSCATSDDGGPCGEAIDTRQYVTYAQWHESGISGRKP